MQVEVECYSGVRYAERPRFLHWEGERLEITSVLAQARLPEGLHFDVLLDNGHVFRLTYLQSEDSWQAFPRQETKNGTGKEQSW